MLDYVYSFIGELRAVIKWTFIKFPTTSNLESVGSANILAECNQFLFHHGTKWKAFESASQYSAPFYDAKHHHDQRNYQ